MPSKLAKTARNAEVLRLRQQGQTLAAIGRQMGVTTQRIHQIVHRAPRSRIEDGVR
jgi:DNA-directed RNA polymerase sigma subunit (sigma70/sigma32)